MSYIGFPGYGQDYGSSNDQNAQNGYGSARSTTPNASYGNGTSYQTNPRISQYPSPDEFAWPTQNQQPQENHSEQTQYSGAAWKGNSSQTSRYEYQTPQTEHTKLNPNLGDGQTYYSTASRNPTRPSTQALNELAYASGLEAASVRGPASHNASKMQAPERLQNRQNTSMQSRPVNPPSSKTNQSCPRINEANLNTYQNDYQSTTSQNSLLNFAAAASASAAAREHRSSPPRYAKPVSQAMENRASLPASSKASSYFGRVTLTAENRTQSSQSQPVQQSVAGHRKSVSDTPVQSLLTSSSHQQRHDTAQIASLSSNTARQIGSIADLVNNEHPQGDLVYSPQSEPQNSVATFINPREVFNPYHKEHERVRREAAEAEAVAKRKAQAEALRIKSISAGPKAVLQPSLVTFQAQPAVSAQRQASPAKPDTVKARPNVQTKPQTLAIADFDTAAELKAMMERMKELRSRDPALFQQVWDESTKRSSAGVAAINPTAPVPAGASQPVFHKTAPRPASSTPTPSLAGPPDMLKGFNGYKVVVEDNPDGAPDLGRFPAERRIRHSHKRSEPSQQQKGPQYTSPLATPTLDAESRQSKQPLVFNTSVIPAGIPSKQILPSKSSDESSVWPGTKRKALAEAAISFLGLNPQNAELSISHAEFVQWLDRNPSYIDLCLLLEKRGFKFDRGSLARSLLSMVPVLATPKQQPVSISVSPAGQMPAPIVDPGRPVANSAGSYMKPEYPPSALVNSSRGFDARHQTLTSGPRPRLSWSPPKLAAPIPGSKEDLARKRDFDDLIDLTQGDDEEYVVPMKIRRVKSSSPEPIETSASIEQQARPHLPSSSFVALDKEGLALIPQSTVRLRFDSAAPQNGLPFQKAKSVERVWTIRADKIKKAEALRKSYYDPKTVARDILIAAGRHPTERPLNAHMAGLLGTHLEIDSDLSTFDWEDIDPGGPPPPKVRWVDVPSGPPRLRRLNSKKAGITGVTNPNEMKSNDNHNPIDRLDTDVTKIVARPAQMQTETANAPRLAASGLLQQARRESSPAAAIRLEQHLKRLAQQTDDIFRTSLPKTKEPAQVPSQRRQPQASRNETGDPHLNGLTPRKPTGRPRSGSSPHRSPKSKIQYPRPPSTVRSESTETTKMEGNAWPSGARRGRPHGSKNKKPGVRATVQVVIPSMGKDSHSPPKFLVYKCKWFNKCDAQLHNLSTLRRHIAKVHRPSPADIGEHGFVCWWATCKLLQKDEYGDIGPTKTFHSDAEWLNHITDEHMHPLGMKYGDGPSTAHIGKQMIERMEFDVSKYFYIPSVKPKARIVSYTDPLKIQQDRAAYLADEHGRTTTQIAPEGNDPDLPRDALVLTRVAKPSDDLDEKQKLEVPLRYFMKIHGNPKIDPKESAAQLVRAMTVRKEKIGVGIDRGGCTLINDARRATLVQNPKISRVIDDY